jgi:xylulokinase
MSLLGIDLGTTGIKGAVYNEDGRLLGKAYREFVHYTPGPGMVELDPNIVWKTLCDSIRELTSVNEVRYDPISALSMSVSGCEAIPLDRDGNTLYNAIMSLDRRGKQENDWIIKRIGKKRLYEITGQPPGSFYALNRLVWFKKNKPHIFEKIYKFLSWEDYILFKFGADPVTDYSIATNTLAFDIIKKQWSEEVLRNVAIDRDVFPEAYPSGIDVGHISAKISGETGLTENVRLVTGGFDQTCAALGAGVIRRGMASVGTGTMEVMHVCLDSPVSKDQMVLYGYPICAHVVNDLYLCYSLNFCGGVLLKWYRDNFAREKVNCAGKEGRDAYDVLMKAAEKAQQPVLFLPYFEGSQTSMNDPHVEGSILGMNLRTKNEDVLYGMLEGITFDLKLNLGKIEEAGTAVDSLRAIGGGARSDIWLRLKANITGKTIEKLNVDEAGCVSTAILAGCGTGKFNSVEETVGSWVKVSRVFHPDMEMCKKYEQKYQQFLSAYESLKKYKIIH